MPGVSYVDLDLLIQVARSQYRAHILNAPAGQVAADFALTVSAPEFQDLMSQVQSALSMLRWMLPRSSGACSSARCSRVKLVSASVAVWNRPACGALGCASASASTRYLSCRPCRGNIFTIQLSIASSLFYTDAPSSLS